MVVPKTTETIYGWWCAGSTDDYTSNPIPTSPRLCCAITENSFVQITKMKKKNVGMRFSASVITTQSFPHAMS